MREIYGEEGVTELSLMDRCKERKKDRKTRKQRKEWEFILVQTLEHKFEGNNFKRKEDDVWHFYYYQQTERQTRPLVEQLSY